MTRSYREPPWPSAPGHQRVAIVGSFLAAQQLQVRLTTTISLPHKGPFLSGMHGSMDSVADQLRQANTCRRAASSTAGWMTPTPIDRTLTVDESEPTVGSACNGGEIQGSAR